MLKKRSEDGYHVAAEGIERKTLAYGDKMLMTEFRMKKGASLARHSHPHEQTGYLVQGRLRFFIGDDEHDIRAGDSWSIPGGVEHGGETLEEAVAVEVFAPVRDDYLP